MIPYLIGAGFVCACSLLLIAAAYYHDKEPRPARNVTGLVEFTEYHSGQSCWIHPAVVQSVMPGDGMIIIDTFGGSRFAVHGTSESVALALGITVKAAEVEV